MSRNDELPPYSPPQQTFYYQVRPKACVRSLCLKTTRCVFTAATTASVRFEFTAIVRRNSSVLEWRHLPNGAYMTGAPTKTHTWQTTTDTARPWHGRCRGYCCAAGSHRHQPRLPRTHDHLNLWLLVPYLGALLLPRCSSQWMRGPIRLRNSCTGL